MPKDLYYIDSIYQREGSDPVEGYITLISTDADDEGIFIPITIPFSRRPMVIGGEGNRMAAAENTYVYLKEYEQGGEISLENANRSDYAQLQFRQMSELRQLLHVRYGNVTDTPNKDENLILAHPTEIYSYHVNVGHGNCTFILIISGNRHLIWAVDSSVIEARWNLKVFIDHQKDFLYCLGTIARKLHCRVSDLHINRFYLTHPHYDHYNGMFFLRDKGLLDNNTIYYINYYYDCSNESFHNYLKYLYDANARIIEPISSKGLWPFVQILHPECRIYKKGDVSSSSDSLPKREESLVNNASVVYNILIGSKSMVFPGDLQLSGFDAMTKAGGCCNLPKQPDYYAISHHGSENGHPFRRCHFHRYGYPIVCLGNFANKAILMGKHGVYSGIFHKDVIRFFNHHNKLVTTDMMKGPLALRYLCLNWISGCVDYEY